MYEIFINIMYIVAIIITGALFGFLLQKGGVSNFNIIVGQFLFKNITVLQIMLSAIIVGGITIYSLVYLNIIPALPAKASSMYGSALGGIIFGAGMALLGYCPGTALTALGQGAKDALFGIIGMIVGALIVQQATPWITKNILIDAPSALTLPELLHICPWAIFLGLVIMLFGVNFLFKKLNS